MLGLRLLERIWLMDKRFGLCGMALALIVACVPLQAQDRSGVSSGGNSVSDVRDMDTVVVTGVQPGPGLWRARHPNGHTLYILGTQSPLPAGMSWRADEVRGVLAEAGAVLGSPGAQLDADVGFFGRLALAPAALRASRNPEGATLDELLPPDVYAQWTALKARYIGRDRGIERKRPFIAVNELYRAALKQHGLLEGGIIALVIDEALKDRDMERISTTVKVPIEDPRAALASFRRETMQPEEVDCVRATLGVIERDLPGIAARANAWAGGDLDVLRAMPDPRSQVTACLSALHASQTAQKLGMAGVQARADALWLEAVDKAMAEHATVFATLSISTLLREGELLAALRARGYTVLAPDEADTAAEDAPSVE